MAKTKEAVKKASEDARQGVVKEFKDFVSGYETKAADLAPRFMKTYAEWSTKRKDEEKPDSLKDFVRWCIGDVMQRELKRAYQHAAYLRRLTLPAGAQSKRPQPGGRTKKTGRPVEGAITFEQALQVVMEQAEDQNQLRQALGLIRWRRADVANLVLTVRLPLPAAAAA
jgi:hypothetical protein